MAHRASAVMLPELAGHRDGIPPDTYRPRRAKWAKWAEDDTRTRHGCARHQSGNRSACVPFDGNADWLSLAPCLCQLYPTHQELSHWQILPARADSPV